MVRMIECGRELLNFTLFALFKVFYLKKHTNNNQLVIYPHVFTLIAYTEDK